MIFPRILKWKALMGAGCCGVALGSLVSCSSQPVLPSLSVQSGALAKPGQVVWHDLATPSASKSKQFYSGLLGWSFEDAGSGYSVIRSGEEIIGGMAEARNFVSKSKSGIWMTSIAVDDIDVAVSDLTKVGATITSQPFKAPNRGKIATVRDPQGALIQLVEIENTARVAPTGTWIWHDLVTSDPKSAALWYSNLDGVSYRSLGSHGRYQLTSAGKKTATISKNPFIDTRNTWVPVIAVSDLKQKVALVDSLDGRVILPPSSDYGKGEIAFILDSTNAPIILEEK